MRSAEHHQRFSDYRNYPAIRANLFEIADAASKENAGKRLTVFATEAQTGHVLSLRDYQAHLVDAQPQQQSLSILRGEASVLIDKEENEMVLSEGDIMVLPSNRDVMFYDTRDGFLGYSVSSAPSKTSTPRGDHLVRRNVSEAYRYGVWEPFMSTHGAGTEIDAPSEVFEVDLFHPGMEEGTHALDDSQAARLLILNKPTVLDRHTHPVAQHHLYIEQGKAKVEHEGTYHILQRGDIFVVQTGARHALGAEEATEDDPTLVVVVNSPGIPSTGDHYSEPA